jgi:transcriptional regulator with XRE-family HTH domain
VIKINMGFWQNVEDECDYLGISRKELAEKAGFSVHTISNGIKRDGMPTADLAVKISKILNVPLEKLLEFKEDNKKSDNKDIENQKLNRKLFSTYLPLIKKIDDLKPDSKKAVFTIIENLK